MGLGNDHFVKILTELHKKGITPTDEEIRELKLIANQIDDLYKVIIDNQEAFGIPKVFIKDTNGQEEN